MATVQFSPTEINEYREVFNSFDRNHDGNVTVSELSVVMQRLGQHWTEDDIKDMLTHANINGRSTLDFQAFLNLMSRSRIAIIDRDESRKRVEQEMRQAFKVFDKDGNGLIDQKELRETMKSLGEKLSKQDVKAMIKAADKNGDGKIDYEEFIKMMYAK